MLQFDKSVWSRDFNATLSPAFNNPKAPSIENRKDDVPRAHKKIGNRVLMMGRVRELALYRAEVLKHSGFQVSVSEDLDQALRIMQSGEFDAIVLSYRLPSETVEYMVERAREYCPSCPIIAITHSPAADRRIQPDAIALANEGPSALITALDSVLEVRS